MAWTHNRRGSVGFLPLVGLLGFLLSQTSVDAMGIPAKTTVLRGNEGKGCPSDCSGHGFCHEGGICRCVDGYTGMDCHKAGCPGDCTGHGRCFGGVCKCDKGWQGDACEVKKVPCPGNCSGHGKCDNTKGFCKCDVDWKGSACADRNATVDEPSPWECPLNCSNAGVCTEKGCVCDHMRAGKYCQFDAPWCAYNCSNVGKCNLGRCSCPEGYQGEFCEYLPCKNNCNGHGACVKSQCQCAKGWAGTLCDVEVCPNGCSGNGVCNDGKCKCHSFYYGPACNLTYRCPKNCDGYGTCIEPGYCLCREDRKGLDCGAFKCFEKSGGCNGHGTCRDKMDACVCDRGFYGKQCQYKECEHLNNCTDEAHGVCRDGSCVCKPTWGSPDCSKSICPNGCTSSVRGECLASGMCHCHGTYGGKDCSECITGYGGENCSTLLTDKPKQCQDSGCSGHGFCNKYEGKCYCDPGWAGADCSKEVPVKIIPYDFDFDDHVAPIDQQNTISMAQVNAKEE